MSKTNALILFSAGLLLTLLLLPATTPPAIALQPPPPPPPPGPPCRLATNPACDLAEMTAFLEANAGPFYNPPLDAREVATTSLISTAFDRPLNRATLNRDTFFVTDGEARLEGRIDYLEANRLAVFYPATPLAANRRYTATLTTGVRTQAGESLPTARVWTFTTTAPGSSFQRVTQAGVVASAATAMQVYFGDLHAHTGYSGGAPGTTPAQAFAGAIAGGLDFYAVTEHDRYIEVAEWQDVLIQAEAVTEDNVFVGLRGFEYTSPTDGHINVFETESYISAADPNYDDITAVYAWLLSQPEAIGQFNHPQWNLNFNNFAYVPAADHPMVLREVTTLEQALLSLSQGWHVGTLLNSDTHKADWGCCRRMGLLAPSLTKADILAAMRAGRTFYVSPFDPNFALVLQANGTWMGSAVAAAPTLEVTVTAYDSNPTGAAVTYNLYENGALVANTVLPGNTVSTWTPTVAAKLGAYYFVEAYRSDWLIPAYSSPIWVEQTPLVALDAPLVVAPGQTVTLDGSGSYDPDGDALAYQWTQEGGPGVTLSDGSISQPTFVAPAQEGPLTFRLTVVDPGGLSTSDTVSVTVTDKPFLTISKTGPLTVETGTPIAYSLTITNIGLTEATDVVITDAVPTGATYLEGGTLLPTNVVSWSVPSLAPNGGTATVTFAVTATKGIVNERYGATCADCIPAVGQIRVVTNGQRVYLPLVQK